jgi:hypothetical protein
MTFVLPLFACAFGGMSASCSITASPEPPVVIVPAATGSFTLRWSIDGTDDPSACSAYDATTLELVIYDESGTEVTTVDAPCETFSVSVPLPEGTYSADATLVDDAGNSRTLTKPLQAIEVVAGTDIAIDLDFPAGSFL